MNISWSFSGKNQKQRKIIYNIYIIIVYIINSIYNKNYAKEFLKFCWKTLINSLYFLNFLLSNHNLYLYKII